MGDDFDRDAKFSFPKSFCLGEIVTKTDNDTECQTPAGLAAISYDVNPLVTD